MNHIAMMRRYLLGTATPDERIAVENDYLPNAEAFEELTAAESDLIDSYARGKLSTAERQAFEKRYLSSVQSRSRVEFALAFADITKEEALAASPKEARFLQTLLSAFRPLTLSTSWRLASACALVLIVGLVSLRVFNHHESNAGPSQPSKQSDQPAGLRQSPSGSESPTGSPQLLAKNAEPTPQDFPMHLESDVSRALASGPQRFVVPTHTEWLAVRVDVPDDESRPLSAVLQTPEGNQVFRADHTEITASQGGRLLRVRIPVARMPAGDYILDLKSPSTGSGKEETVTSCSFRLTYK